MVARVLVALVAVLVLAWVAVLLRDYEVGKEPALRAFLQNISTAQRAADLRDLQDAELLNPDSYYKVSRASSYLLSGRPDRAARLAQAVLRGEPRNITAWVVLARATQRSDPARAAHARAEIRRLDPFVLL